MRAGISTSCFYPQVTEDALREIAGMQIPCAEIFSNCGMELSPSFARELRKIADDGGVSLLSLHPYTSEMETMLFFTAYTRRFQEGRELYKRYYEAAAILGARIVVFHGSNRALPIEYEEYIDRFGRLMEDAHEMGIQLCQENVNRCLSRSPELFCRLAKAFPQAGFVFDVKQAVRAGQDVYAFARAMGNNIRHVHISDHTERSDCLPPGQGVLNMSKLLEIIGNNSTCDGFIVELYRNSFASNVELYHGYKHIFHNISTVS